jgi:hypothetical protein
MNEIEYEGKVLPTPPVSPRRRSSAADAGLIVVGLLIFGAVSNTVEDKGSASAAPITSSTDVGTSYEVTADEIVDYMESTQPGTEAEFCGLYAQLGYSQGLASFESGYGSGQNPSASEVFDELVSRC